MGIPTLIATLTASNSSSVADTSSMTSTYDEYMFVCTDIAPATDDTEFGFQVNVDGESGYNETISSASFIAYHNESDSATSLAYHVSTDMAQETGYQLLSWDSGNGSDESLAGILHIYSPANTTYVTSFLWRANEYYVSDYSWDQFTGGYINATGAITDISFKFSSGNFDGVIQIYGIA